MRNTVRGLGIVLIVFGIVSIELGCAGSPIPEPQTRSLLGEPLYRPDLPSDFVAEQEQLLAEARSRTLAEPTDLEAWIWLGRRQAYLGHYRTAVKTFTHAARIAPDDPRPYRHRGHRWISLRDFERAVEDLRHAKSLMLDQPDRIEPDGLPNIHGIPTSTLYTNVYYHLGLAHYLRGEFELARNEYTAGLEAAKNPDMKSAMTYWLILSHWRWPGNMADLGALIDGVDPDWTLLENEDYHAMVRSFAPGGSPTALLDGARSAGGVRFATVGYGVGAWHWRYGRREEARALWSEVVEAGPWNAFGAIAAEADLAR